MEYGLFDTHVHLDDEKFDNDREELIKALPSLGIAKVTNVGADIATSVNSVELSEKYNYIYASVGVHPSETADLAEKDIMFLESLAKEHKKVVAIGEIGLDYHWDDVPRDIQKKWFSRQMELARELSLPVILHLRDAYEDALEIMNYFGKMPENGVVHCFSGSPEFAECTRKLGYKIGVGGVLTFSNAKKLVNVVKNADISEILLETDCPYMAPVPHRGERNNPSLTKFVAEKISELKGIPVDNVIKATYLNAMEFYGIDL